MASALLHYLGSAARAVRKEHHTKLVRVGARLDKSESSLSRFENGRTWPNDLDAAMDAYAEELGVSPLVILERAVELWKDDVSRRRDGEAPESQVRRAAQSAKRLAQREEQAPDTAPEDQLGSDRREASR